jgi:hypothetical protein
VDTRTPRSPACCAARTGRGSGEATKRLVAEKRRDERLAEAGFEVVHVVWRDLKTPEQMCQRVRAAFARAALRPAAAGRAVVGV